MRPIVRVGFTGTREGMTDEQRQSVDDLLHDLRVDQFHHGDCVGADVLAAMSAKRHGAFVTSHPCNSREWRAFSSADEVRKVKPPLARNKDIVQETDILIVAPKQMQEVIRSGTWSTYRYAKVLRAAGKRQIIYLVLPDGTIQEV